MILWLIGMMGTGKSTVGEIVARSKNIPFLDTDRLVEAEAGSSISEIWSGEGEWRFRQLESLAVASVPDRGPCVVATGGGVVLAEANRSVIDSEGTVVWLRAGIDHLLGNVGKGPVRPLVEASGDVRTTLVGILREREETYLGLADLIVDVDGRTPSDVADEIVSLWN